MIDFEKLLSGGDLRSIGKSNSVAALIKSQSDFDQLFTFLFNNNRLMVMRAADALEKISMQHPEWLTKHKKELLALCKTAENKELRWHLALMLPRLPFGKTELTIAWDTLVNWAQDAANSKIVRVNAIQGLFELQQQHVTLSATFFKLLAELEKENIASLNARIRKLKTPPIKKH